MIYFLDAPNEEDCIEALKQLEQIKEKIISIPF